jgi:hypothetical protein
MPTGDRWREALTMTTSSTTGPGRTGTRASRRAGALATLILLGTVAPSAAQESVADVLAFLLTNRTIVTDDFDRDAEAAAATHETIARFLTLELAVPPVSASPGGFAYRLDPTLGIATRSSDSFGPFVTERALTASRNRTALGISVRSTTYDHIGSHDLRDGTLVSTASILGGDSAPFDEETVSLRIRTDTVTFLGTYGVADRLDLSLAVPYIRLRLEGERLDTYRGSTTVQATGTATASGFGDAVVRVKYHAARAGAGGLALGIEARLPTGDETSLLGAGRVSLTPRLIASYEGRHLGLHGEGSYSSGGAAHAITYGTAVTVAAAPRLTLVGEVAGRRVEGLGTLTQVQQPHPRLDGVETIRLTAAGDSPDRVVALAGFKWNVAGGFLLTANVLRPLTRVGLTASWVPSITVDYSFEE